MAKKITLHYWLLPLIAAVLFVSGALIHKWQQTPASLGLVTAQLQDQLAAEDASFGAVARDTALIGGLLRGSIEQPSVWYSLLLYRNDSLVYWNRNEVLPPRSFVQGNTDATRLLRLPNGYYQLCKKTIPASSSDTTRLPYTLKVVALQLIQYQYDLQNKYLSNDFNPLLDLPAELVLSGGTLPSQLVSPPPAVVDSTATPSLADTLHNKAAPAMPNAAGANYIYNPTRTDFIYLSYDTHRLQQRINHGAIACQLLGIWVLLAWFTLLCWYLASERRRPSEALVLMALLLLLVQVAMSVLDIPVTMHSMSLFANKPFSRYGFYTSPGDLLLHAMCVAYFVGFFYKTAPLQHWLPTHYKSSQRNLMLYLCSVTFLFALTYSVYYATKIVIYYFDVKFDIINFIYINNLSILALFTIAFVWVTYILLLQKITQIIEQLQLHRWQVWLGAALMMVYYLPILYFFTFYWEHLFTLSWLLVLLLIMRYGSVGIYPQPSPFRLFGYVAFFAVWGTILVLHFGNRRTTENMRTFAGKIAIQEDPITEELLDTASVRIISDNRIPFYFSYQARYNPPPESLDKYVKSKYLSNAHFEQYEIEVTAFDTNKEAVDNREQRTLSATDYEYKTTNTLRTNNNYIFLMRGQPGSYNYLAKLPIFDAEMGAPIGYLYIEMRPKLDKTNVYPELTLEDRYRRSDESADYDYAIYNDRILESQRGNFPYTYRQVEPFVGEPNAAVSDTVYTQYNKRAADGTTQLASRDTILVNYFSTPAQGGYRHLVYNLLPSKTVVVSQESSSILSALSLFSYLFITLLIIFSVVVAFIAFVNGESTIHFIKNLLYNSLRRRINMLMITVLLVSFVAIGAATTSYFFNLSDEHNRSRLLQKQGEILAAIETDLRSYYTESSSTELQNMLYNKEYLSPIIKKLSEIHAIDINLFDLNGQLISTSQPRIFNRRLLSEQINPQAYYAIARQFDSQYIQTETIGKLTYIAAYMPLKNKQNELIGFLNIPYFAREKEMRSEIARFLAQIINVYIFLLVIGSVLAVFVSNTITNPLLMISEKLRGIQLGKTNELLAWPDNDEIGALVSQYNATIKELESSVKLLAQSERQNAWQSMARQVAHEIKNPLTPMKLGIEHLQRAYRDRHPKVQEMTERTMHRLIEQIDLLSQIATEFSNFAKMPKPNNEIINLKDVIGNVIGLYNDAQEAHLYAKLPDRPCYVYADKNQLIRVFTNLIKNAIQAIPPDRRGVIVVNMRLSDKNALIAVADNGIGISPEQREKVFSPNFTTKNSGMGLGLAMSQSIIEAAKGKIWFESEVNIGTSFFVRLPLIQPPQEQIEAD